MMDADELAELTDRLKDIETQEKYSANHLSWPFLKINKLLITSGYFKQKN